MAIIKVYLPTTELGGEGREGELRIWVDARMPFFPQQSCHQTAKKTQL